MTDGIQERFKARRFPIADVDRAPEGWLTTPQPSSIVLIDGDVADALPAIPEPATRLQVGPGQWLIVSETDSPGEMMSRLTSLPREIMVTDLSHARFRIRLHGSTGCEALRSGVAIDLHPATCPVGHSTPTTFREIAVMLHAVRPDTFDLYVLRSYAISLREWLEDAATGQASAE